MWGARGGRHAKVDIAGGISAGGGGTKVPTVRDAVEAPGVGTVLVSPFGVKDLF